MTTDRFGNPLAPGLPYARGEVIRSTEDDLRKLARAWRTIRRIDRERGREGIFNFTGLERALPLAPEEIASADDELAPALWGDRFQAVALAHLGGDPARHDVAVFNRLTAATVATHLALVEPGDVVLGVSPTYSHPTIARAAAVAGARFVEARGLRGFEDAMMREPRVALVALTRLAVSYDLMSVEELREVVRLAHARGAIVYVDDAGGARVGPAIFGQPKTLELEADLGATGLDKYGTVGPRVGLLGGDARLVARIRARAIELGLDARPMLYPAVVRSLEQYRPERVRELVATTREVAGALRAELGDLVVETPLVAKLLGEDLLALALREAALASTTVVPIEATAALAMLLLEQHGVLTVHFAGLPPGTSALLVKFVPPETLARFGGGNALAKAIADAAHQLGPLVAKPDRLREVLLGDEPSAD